MNVKKSANKPLFQLNNTLIKNIVTVCGILPHFILFLNFDFLEKK